MHNTASMSTAQEAIVISMLLSQVANTCYDSLLALLYPQQCAVCGGSVESRAYGVACGDCWQRTILFSGTEIGCWKCGRLLVGSVGDGERKEVFCHRCDDAAFTAVRACGVYDGAIRASVLHLKHRPHLNAEVSRRLLHMVQQNPLNLASIIIPVPLHPSREAARGYNQAAIIATEVAKQIGLPLQQENLIRVKHVEQHRAGMDAKGRHDTVAESFQVIHPRLIEGERVLLIDDVFTTGATVSSCAAVLKEAGARDVFVLTIARPLFD